MSASILITPCLLSTLASPRAAGMTLVDCLGGTGDHRDAVDRHGARAVFNRLLRRIGSLRGLGPGESTDSKKCSQYRLHKFPSMYIWTLSLRHVLHRPDEV